ISELFARQCSINRNRPASPTGDTDRVDEHIFIASGWALIFSGGSSTGATANVRAYGADVTGSTDATTALNRCLRDVGQGGTCLADGAKLKLLGNVIIPAHTTLSCGNAFLDSEDGDVYQFAALPALMLDSGHTIGASGQGASVKNCLVYRNGMTFPAADARA